MFVLQSLPKDSQSSFIWDSDSNREIKDKTSTHQKPFVIHTGEHRNRENSQFGPSEVCIGRLKKIKNPTDLQKTFSSQDLSKQRRSRKHSLYCFSFSLTNAFQWKTDLMGCLYLVVYDVYNWMTGCRSLAIILKDSLWYNISVLHFLFQTPASCFPRWIILWKKTRKIYLQAVDDPLFASGKESGL